MGNYYVYYVWDEGKWCPTDYATFWYARDLGYQTKIEPIAFNEPEDDTFTGDINESTKR